MSVCISVGSVYTLLSVGLVFSVFVEPEWLTQSPFLFMCCSKSVSFSIEYPFMQKKKKKKKKEKRNVYNGILQQQQQQQPITRFSLPHLTCNPIQNLNLYLHTHVYLYIYLFIIFLVTKCWVADGGEFSGSD